MAFGYLSVLLGYLCLSRPIQKKFVVSHFGGSLEPLMGSIREFIAYNEAADSAIEMDHEPTGSTGRLQNLVERLERAVITHET